MNSFKNSTSLYDLHYLSAPTLSADSQDLLYVQTTIAPDTDNYQADIIQHQLLDGTERVLISNGYINKSPLYLNQQLIYLSNQTGNFQVYLYDFATQTSQKLTAAPNGVHSLAANPAHASFLFTTQLAQSRPNQQESYRLTATAAPYYRFDKLKYQADGLGFIDTTQVNYLCEYSLASAEVTVLTPQATGYGLRRVVSVSSDGDNYLLEQLVAQQDDYNSDTALFLYQRQNTELTCLTTEFPTGIFGEAVFSPDQTQIAFLGSPLAYETSNQFNLYLYDVKSRAISQLLENLDIQFGDNSVSDIYQTIHQPFIQWHPNSQLFYVMTSEYGQVFLNEVTLSKKFRRLSPPKSVVKEYTIASDGSILAVISTPETPVGLFKFDGQHWSEIVTRVSQHYAHYDTGHYQEIEMLAEDGSIIHSLISLPPDFDPAKKYPLILNIHGGPYTMHAWNFYHEAQFLSANGYLVLMPNPRGSYGYGQAHAKGVYERYGQEDYTDLMSAVDDVIDKFSYVDDKQLFVMGGSYGGYMTNWIITRNHRFKAAISQRSMSNFVSMFGTSDIGYFFYKDELGLDLSNADQLWERSPLAYVEQVQTPLLLIHAKNDLRCQFDQAQQFYVGLKHYKKDAELLVFPDSSHELSRSGRPSYRLARLEAILDWFERDWD